jgi:hypothetical protein
MTVAGTIFTEVAFVEQIFVSFLITEFREKTDLLFSCWYQVTDGRTGSWGMNGRADGVSEVASTQGVPLNFVQEAENRYWYSIQGGIHHKLSRNNQVL